MAKAAKTSTPPKNIFLFSDGTGNSSAKLQKTNVWRLYEALDMGDPPTAGGRAQIAYYDNGVGTSSIPLVAMIGGAFGFGLPRNVQDIYKFLCRNYQPGDRIYAFGFSRGAFTIRLLAAMVCVCGIIRTHSETDLDLQARDVWRYFRERFKPYYFTPLTTGVRALVRAVVRTKRRLFGQRTYAAALVDRKNPPHKPEIEFLGVWDTVAAYGGPIIELTRAIDVIIWPLTMDDFRLHKGVKCARHALSIDDRRDAFLPLPWDELFEKQEVESGRVPPNRLRQVWFAGMHSDVGGGYSDETLSFVSLVWMIDQFKIPDTRFIGPTELRIRQMKNAFGPIHDSRRGAGMFYRYQPRPLTAWLDPHKPTSWVHLDPSIARGTNLKRTYSLGSRADGLLCSPIKLHRSVWERLQNGTDGYAPINLPDSFDVVDNDYRVAGRTRRAVAGLVRKVRHDPRIVAAADWSGGMIMWRRLAYFLAIFLFTLLLLLPFLTASPDSPSLVQRLLNARLDSRDVIGPLGTLLSALLPKFAETWTNAWLSKMIATLVLVLLLAAAMIWGHSLERALTDQYVRGPRRRLPQPKTPDLFARWLSESKTAQTALFFYKWYLVPILVGFLLLVAGAWIAIATVNRLWLIKAENDACPASPAVPLSSQQPLSLNYDLRTPCQSVGIHVEAESTYTVTITPTQWADASVEASPDGWASRRWNRPTTWLGIVATPFKRVIRAPYLAPLVEIRNDVDAIHIQRVARKTKDDTNWTGSFKAVRSGTLYFFVNDAAFPQPWIDSDNRWWNLGGRYANNCAVRPGKAACADHQVTVTIWSGTLDSEPPPDKPARQPTAPPAGMTPFPSD